MGRLMLNEKCYSGKEATLMLDSINYSYSSGKNDYYLLDPDMLDILGSASGLSGSSILGFASKIQNGSVSITTRNNEKVLYFNCSSNVAYGILGKIDKSCRSIEIDVEVVGTKSSPSTAYQLSRIVFAPTPIPSTYTGWNPFIVNTYLSLYSWTPEQINAQSNVTINSTVQNALSKQTVVFDVASMGLTDDFYLGIQGCESYIYIRSIKILF